MTTLDGITRTQVEAARERMLDRPDASLLAEANNGLCARLRSQWVKRHGLELLDALAGFTPECWGSVIQGQRAKLDEWTAKQLRDRIKASGEIDARFLPDEEHDDR